MSVWLRSLDFTNEFSPIYKVQKWSYSVKVHFKTKFSIAKIEFRIAFGHDQLCGTIYLGFTKMQSDDLEKYCGS